MQKKQFKTGIYLSLRPAIEICGLTGPEKGSVRRHDFYCLDLKSDTIIADGRDSLKVIIFARIMPAAAGERQPPSLQQKIAAFQLNKAALVGKAAAFFELQEEPDDSEFNRDQRNAGCKRLTIRPKSPRPEYFTAAVADTVFNIECEGVIRPPAGAEKSSGRKVRGSIKIIALFFWLKLWVLPAAARGRVDLQALLMLIGSDGQTYRPENVGLEFRVAKQGGGGPQLQILDSAAIDTDCHGRATLNAQFSGMTWENAKSAQFSVKCRVAGATEGTVATIDVPANGREFLDALRAASDQLCLNDRAWKDISEPANLVDFVIPDSVRGALLNTMAQLLRWLHSAIVDDRGERRIFFDIDLAIIERLEMNLPPLIARLERHRCSDISYRICEFALQRRFGADDPETAARMTGLEFAEYGLFFRGIEVATGEQQGVHVFFGLHLSGDAIMRDPRFIDPWWNQQFDEKVVLTWSSMRVKFLATLTFLLLYVVPVLMALFYGVMAILGFLKSPAAVVARKIAPWMPEAASACMRGARTLSGEAYNKLVQPAPAEESLRVVSGIVWSTLGVFSLANYEEAVFKGSKSFDDQEALVYKRTLQQTLVERLEQKLTADGPLQPMNPTGWDGEG